MPSGAPFAVSRRRPLNHSLPPPAPDETIQTTTNHPWLTADHGWILASFLRVGEPDGDAASPAQDVVQVLFRPKAMRLTFMRTHLTLALIDYANTPPEYSLSRLRGPRNSRMS